MLFLENALRRISLFCFLLNRPAYSARLLFKTYKLRFTTTLMPAPLQADFNRSFGCLPGCDDRYFRIGPSNRQALVEVLFQYRTPCGVFPFFVFSQTAPPTPNPAGLTLNYNISRTFKIY
jgi:hypothetical protein